MRCNLCEPWEETEEKMFIAIATGTLNALGADSG